jgi:hypothetical protein
MVQTIEMSYEEKVEMYQLVEKNKLIEMLIEANNVISKLTPKIAFEPLDNEVTNDVDTTPHPIYVVIKCGYEGIEGLIYSTLNADDASTKVKALRDEILSAKNRMNKINEEFGIEEDEHFNTHYERMYLAEEISCEEYSMAKYDNPDAFCVQRWDGEKFECVCKELDCEPSKMWLM